MLAVEVPTDIGRPDGHLQAHLHQKDLVFVPARERLLEAEVADEFFAAVVRQAKLRRYMSSDHFSVDGTLLNAWASHKSFKPKDQPPHHYRLLALDVFEDRLRDLEAGRIDLVMSGMTMTPARNLRVAFFLCLTCHLLQARKMFPEFRNLLNATALFNSTL